jgi:hypothetical protein
MGNKSYVNFERRGSYASPSRGIEQWPVGELICDKCGVHLGYTHEFDLNGSYFFCNECVKEVRNG